MLEDPHRYDSTTSELTMKITALGSRNCSLASTDTARSLVLAPQDFPRAAIWAVVPRANKGKTHPTSGGSAGGGTSGIRKVPGGGRDNASSAPRRKMSSSTGSRFSKTPVPRFSTSSRDEEIYERSLVEGGRGSRPRPPGGLDSG